MENNSKGIAWFRDVCQKIETMYLEVEDIVLQEGCRFVEDQVQTVGENVKQFCSEFVQEVLPQPSVGENVVCDPSLTEIIDGDNKMPNEGMVEDFSEKQPSKDIDSLQTCSRECMKGAQHDLSLEEHVDALIHEKLEISLMEKFLEEKQLHLEMSDKTTHEHNVPSLLVSSPAAFDDVTSKAFLLDTPSSSSAVLADPVESQMLDIEPPSDNGLIGSMRKSDLSINESGTTVLELDCEERLDESCILVDGSELGELSSVSIEAGRPKLPKKKIGPPFFTKRRSAKQDQSSELDSGDSQEKEVVGVVCTSAIISTSNQEICESDWEII